MAGILALIEVCAIFVIVCVTILAWALPVSASLSDFAEMLGQALVLSLSCLCAFYYNDFYDFRTMRSFPQFIQRLPKSLALALIVAISLYTVFPQFRMATAPFVLCLLFVVGLAILIRAVCYGARQHHPFVERVLILGATPLACALIRELEVHPHCTVIGVVDDRSSLPLHPRYPTLGCLQHLNAIVEGVRPDRIIVAMANWEGRVPVRQLLASRVRGIPVEQGVEVYERLNGKLAIESLEPSSLIFSRDFRKSRLGQALRRAISLCAAVIGLILSAPLFVLIALAIKLDSAGPVFFVQDRVGLGGRGFKLIKFRTMHPAQGPTSEWAKDNGDRITRVGRWLRKFRLDELPQFLNILRGDMNLVGPRPHPASNLDLLVLVSRNVPECGEAIPYYSLRSMVRPGVTGWAQVRYRYANDIDEEIEKMRYDLYYIKHLSLWLDLRILFDTVKIVLLGRGGEPVGADHREALHSVSPKDRELAHTKAS